MSGAEVLLADLSGAEGTKNYKQEPRPMRLVRKIVLKGAVDLVFRRFATPQLVVAGETDEAISRVTTRLDGDKLVIESEGIGVSINGVGGVSVGYAGGGVYINGQRVSVNGMPGAGGRVVIGVAMPELPCLKVKGSGDVTLLDLQQAGLQIEIAGSGDVAATGTVGQLEVSIAGSGDVRARDLLARSARLSIAGSGDISAHVTHEVAAVIAGSGDIVIRGEPPVRSKSVQGSGSVKFK